MEPGKIAEEVTTLATALAAWAAAALPNIIVALLLLVAGWALARWAERGVGRLLDRAGLEPTLRSVITTLVRYALLVLVIVAVLGQLGVQTTSVIAALGAIGLAIGLALQGTLANIAAGIMLLWLRPFRVGDYIEAGDISGTVKDVGLFASRLDSWDGVYQFVPNSELWNKRLINYSRLERRLVALKFRIDYADDMARGREVLLALAAADERVLGDPPPDCFVDELAESAVILALRVWTDNATYWPVRRSLTEHGKTALQAAGLSIPHPQRIVHYKKFPRDETDQGVS